MDEWRARLRREGGSIRCKGNCPVHTSCAGAIRARPQPQIDAAQPINGHTPLAECDTCHALFGFEHAALHYLEHSLAWKQSLRPGRPLGVP